MTQKLFFRGSMLCITACNISFYLFMDNPLSVCPGRPLKILSTSHYFVPDFACQAREREVAREAREYHCRIMVLTGGDIPLITAGQ
jgi:hypothetical protein